MRARGHEELHTAEYYLKGRGRQRPQKHNTYEGTTTVMRQRAAYNYQTLC
jgi:hypothetical protein